MYIKNIFVFILCASLAMWPCSAYGEETDTANAAVSEPIVQTVGIEESFDIYSGFYNEKLTAGSEFYSSVPNGAVVSDAVYFDVPTGIVGVEAELDGKRIEFKNKTLYTEKGYYIFKFSSYTVNGDKVAGVFTFRIGDKPNGRRYSLGYAYPAIKCTAEVSAEENGMFSYRLPNYKAFMSNIPGYGANVENARFIIPRNLGYSLTKDGIYMPLVNNRIYDEAGSYKLKVFGSSYAASGGYEAYYETVLDFTVGTEDTEDYLSVPDISAGTPSSVTSNEGAAETPQTGYTYETPQYASADVGAEEAVSVYAQTDADITDINDTLIETYFESAGLYSETFSSGNAFYTNTPNDGIVGGDVYIDIPSDMTVAMTRDGVPVPFENKTYINDEGSYSLILTAVNSGDMLRARYTFRIQSGISTAPRVEEDDEVGYDLYTDTAPSDEESDIEYDIKNSYDSEKMMYVFDGGDEPFYLSVPDGMVTNEDVRADVPSDADVVLKRDGEDIPFTDVISGDGHYEISVGGDNKASFDIVTYSTNRFGEFTAPEGYAILAAEYDDNGLYDKSSDEYINGMEIYENSTSSYVRSMPLDGEYSFMLGAREGRSLPAVSVTFISDRTSPEVIFDGLDENMNAAGESVTVSCSDPEAVLLLGGEPLTMSDGKAEITGSGEYELTVYDPAGNRNEYIFTIGSPAKKGSGSGLFTVFGLFWIPQLIVCLVIILRSLIFNKKRKGDVAPAAYNDKNNADDGAQDDWENVGDDGWEDMDGGERESGGDDNWEDDNYDDWENV